MQFIDIEIAQGIATVWLNRPEKKNALGLTTMRELIQAAQSIRADKSIRVAIIAARGDTFCAGVDLADLTAPHYRKRILWELIKPTRSLFQKVPLVWQTLPIPVLCAVHGYCLGAGLQLALGADIRIATPDSQWAILEARWGIVPDMGITQSAYGLIRADVLRELTYTGRLLSGHEALHYGLTSHLAEDPLAHAYALAEELINRSPDAQVAAKRLYQQMYRPRRRSLYHEKYWQLKLLIGKNQRIAVKKDRDNSIRFLPRQYD